MRKVYNLLIGISLLFTSFFIQGRCFSQVEEEKEERASEMQMLQKKPLSYKLDSSAALFAGYDNNVKLTPIRKGSMFEEFLYSLNFEKPLGNAFRFSFNYDLDYLNYDDMTSSANLMNHLRFGLHEKLNRFFAVGTGYDFSDFYYPNNAAGDFLFHKGFIYLKHSISDTIFHRLTLEYGYKTHTSRKALADSITELQDKTLFDRRQNIEYDIVSSISPKMLLQFRARFSKSNSNARYLDFYDYKSYGFSPAVNYKLSERLNLAWYFDYLRRAYTDRTISTGTRKEKDNVYATNIGARYRLTKDTAASVFYTYRDNSTNEPLEKYTESVFTFGWEHKF